MAKHKHLTQEDRFKIQYCLSQSYSFKKIAHEVNKDCTTISKEIKNHLVFKRVGASGYAYNACSKRFTCTQREICPNCPSTKRSRHCKFCGQCNANCAEFSKYTCSALLKSPYVCNGCAKLICCTLEKRFYQAREAHSEYSSVLSETRSGLSLSECEITHLDKFISPLIMRGQSINHICANNLDSIMVSESTIYRLIDYNLFSARNIDLPRKVKYKSRKIKKHFKVDRTCRIKRTYEDFQLFMQDNPDIEVTQIDSVIGSVGGKVLLTIHFVKAELMLAFLRDSNDSQSVINIFDDLYLQLSPSVFIELMPVLLGDNGSEFSNPLALEYDSQDNKRTSVFYCDPSAPFQKGSAEKNHEFIRMIIPKGQTMNHLTQTKVNLIMNHINSYSRKSLGNKCPYDVFEYMYGKDTLNKLGCSKIPPNDILLHPQLIK